MRIAVGLDVLDRLFEQRLHRIFAGVRPRRNGLLSFREPIDEHGEARFHPAEVRRDASPEWLVVFSPRLGLHRGLDFGHEVMGETNTSVPSHARPERVAGLRLGHDTGPEAGDIEIAAWADRWDAFR